MLLLVTGEASKVWSEPALANPTFLAVAGLSGLIGFAIRYDECLCHPTAPHVF